MISIKTLSGLALITLSQLAFVDAHAQQDNEKADTTLNSEHPTSKKTEATKTTGATVATEATEATEETIVTATRIEQNLDDVLASASVINHTEIARIQPFDLSDLFEQSAGLSTVRSGGPGSVTSLRTRGTNSDHTLMLINGMRFNSATLGDTQFQFIDPELISRVEIVRGSQSALYGSDAIGGVVQVFTDAKNLQPSTFVSANLGSNNYRRVAVGTRGQLDNFRYTAALSTSETDGMDRLTESSGDNTDIDGHNNTNVNLFAGYTFRNDFDLNFSHVNISAETEYDDPWSTMSRPYSEVDIEVTQLALSAPVNSLYNANIALGQSSEKSDNLNHIVEGFTRFQTKRKSLLWQNNFTFNEYALISAGLDYYNEEIDTTTAHPVKDRRNSALYIQWQGKAQDLSWKFGLRNDNHDRIDSQDTRSMALGYQLTSQHKIFTSWSEGFRAPTFNDLYWPAAFGSAGNPNLKSELSENIELGIKGRYDNFDWEVTAFKNTVNNLIDWAKGSDDVWRPSNIANAEFKGIEMATKTRLGPINITADAHYIASKDIETQTELQNRSRRKASIEFSHDIAKLNYGLILHHQGSRINPSETLESYELVSVIANYTFTDSLSVKFRLDNVLDTEYRQTPNYTEEGQTGRIGIRYQF
ncbi:MAG: vitamin B12 transporter [Flavobacteriales bacterium]|jgi:vitamin B12 transporter